MLVLAGDEEPDPKPLEQPPEVAPHPVREPVADSERGDARQRNHLCWIAERASVLFEQRQGLSSKHRQCAGFWAARADDAWRTVWRTAGAPSACWLSPCR